MWFDGVQQPNTLYIASVSRGKDSTAMLRAIQLMGWPLDGIASVDIWFDKDTPAELPPMVAFKDEWDAKCEEWFGVPVTRLCARKKETGETLTYTDVFYRVPNRCSRNVQVEREREREREVWQAERIPASQRKLVYRPKDKPVYGFPWKKGAWCNDRLKATTLERVFSDKPANDGRKINIVHYIGIAADEPKRIARHIDKQDKILPLVQIGWDEDLCGLEATYMDMLAPTYTDGSLRDGCWFCHNQSVGQLRKLRHNYPDLWEKLMKLDTDSPVTFKADGHTVHDFDKRFALEDAGLIDSTERWSWKSIEEDAQLQYRMEGFT